MTDESFNG